MQKKKKSLYNPLNNRILLQKLAYLIYSEYKYYFKSIKAKIFVTSSLRDVPLFYSVAYRVNTDDNAL